MTAKIEQGIVTPGCELENVAFAGMLHELRASPDLAHMLTVLEVTAACKGECRTLGECPRLDGQCEIDLSHETLVHLAQGQHVRLTREFR